MADMSHFMTYSTCVDDMKNKASVTQTSSIDSEAAGAEMCPRSHIKNKRLKGGRE